MTNFGDKVSFIWSVANLLRGPYHPNQYKDIMLPLTVLRRLDCVLEPTKDKVLRKIESLKDTDLKNQEPLLNSITGFLFHNTSKYNFERLKADPDSIAQNLIHYIKSFSTRARDIIEYFDFEQQIAKLDSNNILYPVVCKFAEIDLHPDKVSNIEMGYIFEELIRKFYDLSNEEAGDHFTPREVIRLMVDAMFLPDNDILTTKGIIKKLYDPACGTGGMLSVSDEYLHELNPDAHLEAYGQDYNPQSYAICGSDMMIKGQNLDNIYFGDSFKDDHFAGQKFDYLLANPPYGVEWKKQKNYITKEYEQQGFGGRFGAGLPRISDGQLLFLQHMLSKMKPTQDGGTRIGIVMNGSPLFTGGAGSGESEIRKWIIENDWLEAIIALPDQLFYNTGISTYIWIVTNRKSNGRRGKIQLINGVSFAKKMRKSLGNKRNEICDDQRKEIIRLYGEFKESEYCKIYPNHFFGYQRITVERPLRLAFKVDVDSLLKLYRVVIRKKNNPRFINADNMIAAIENATDLGDHEICIKALYPLAQEGVFKNQTSLMNRIKEREVKRTLKFSSGFLESCIDAFGFKDETADVFYDSKGNPKPDPVLRDNENVPLGMDIDTYMQKEVLPHVPDAWVDYSKTKIGYELNFNRYFYKYIPPRPLEEIETELKAIEQEIADLLTEV